MNVNDYAEKVLFSTDLNEKLRLASGTIEFDFQQTKISSGMDPGRPDALLFAPQRDAKRVSLPSRPSLVNDQNRGTLLHFFANHELLAAELMALALLKFPNAPIEFRQGLFETLREEQKHTIWYLGRMKECGVTLGDFPVSRFFWDTVSTMETPFDYVSRLSLTFEQANLDYSRHFGSIMKEAGDARTAKIMDKIYRDEIDHVGYGLKWFRHWKKSGESDWEAYRGSLALPLSPSRAKGNGVQYNQAGRLEAGLNEDFVRNLAVFEKSKGRTPNVFYFNPDAEDLINCCAQSYHPAPKVKALICDLEVLMFFVSRQDDVVLMRKPPSLSHLERLRGAGFQLPEIEALDDSGNVSSETSLNNRKVRALKPWSVAPDLPKRFEPYIDGVLWRDNWESLFGKAEQADRLSAWMDGARSCRSKDEVIEAITASKCVLKRSISAAGRGVRFCDDRETALNLAMDWLSKDGKVVIEPHHNRIFDFSVQFEITATNISRIGLIRQSIDNGGRYRGSVSSPKFCKGLPEDISRFLMTGGLAYFDESSSMIREIFDWARGLKYVGPIGIDSYLYRDNTGGIKIRPICEINPRYTMGRVVHELRKSIDPGCSLGFQIEKVTPNHKVLVPERNPVSGKMSGGSICLNEIDSDTVFAAIIKVEKHPNDL